MFTANPTWTALASNSNIRREKSTSISELWYGIRRMDALMCVCECMMRQIITADGGHALELVFDVVLLVGQL
jgi:hypothetical protein